MTRIDNLILEIENNLKALKLELAQMQGLPSLKNNQTVVNDNENSETLKLVRQLQSTKLRG